MGRTLNSSQDIGGEGKAVSEGGTFHCSVVRSADGASTKGNSMNGISALLTVLAGTVPSQVEKEFHLHLYDPDLSKSEASQEWSTKKQTAYAIAINQMEPSKLGESVEVEFGEADGQQIIITLEESEYEGKKSIDLAYASIFHVDDPRAANFPKSKEGLSILPAELRRKPEYFAALVKKTSPPAMQPGQKKVDNADLTKGL